MTVLHEFLSSRRAEILERARERITSRSAPRATPEELEIGVPSVLDQLGEILRSEPSERALAKAATRHGRKRMESGFTIAQVVHDYGDVCQAITEVAGELGAAITIEEFGTLNRVLDDAIAFAVSEHSHRRELSIAAEGTERLGVLAHEMRNLVHTAKLAFASLQAGSVPVRGATGAVLSRTLDKLSAEIDRSLTLVRLDAGLVHATQFPLADLVEEVEAVAALEGAARGIAVETTQVDRSILITADRQLLGAALSNLLQNAIKFTPSSGHVALRASETAERVSVEVEDRCGGLPPGQIEELFASYTQLGTDRSGVGLGLTVCRRAAASMGGELHARNLPGVGCVFTLDLPRTPARASSAPA